MWRIISGLWMGCGLGSNDAANLFGTGVAAKVIKYRMATILIAFFVILGAALEGPKCMDTLGKLANVSSANEAFVILLATAVSVMIMTLLGIPISTSQAVVGSILGSVVYRIVFSNIDAGNSFEGLPKIVMCWVGTPIGSMIIAFILYYLLDKIINKYIKNIIVLNYFIKYSLIFAGCYGAYSLGANNVANTTAVYVSAGMLTPFTAALIGGISIAAGALLFSKNVMITVGKKITVIGPLGALIAEMSHSLTVHFYTQIGVPVSSSQAIVGAVIGIGLVKGTKTISVKKIVHIVLGWVFTPLSAGIFSFGLIWLLTILGFTII